MKGKLVLMREETELWDDASITTARLPQRKGSSSFSVEDGGEGSPAGALDSAFSHHAAH